MIQICNPNIYNLGDFLNSFPILSGLAKELDDTIKLVLPDNFKQYNGLREFFEYQDIIDSVYFQSEIYNMDGSKYLFLSYPQEEFKYLTERPLVPIETLRYSKFIKDAYSHLTGDVDEEFCFRVEPMASAIDPDLYVVGDRWNKIVDTRRDWNILKKSGLFDDPSRFYFLDYEKCSTMQIARIILNSNKPFIGTFTGSGMLADLLKKETICVYDDSMLPLWNGMKIEYSYWKHFFGDRKSSLAYIKELPALL